MNKPKDPLPFFQRKGDKRVSTEFNIRDAMSSHFTGRW